MIHEHPHFMLIVAVLAAGMSSIVARCFHDLMYPPPSAFIRLDKPVLHLTFTQFLFFYWRRMLIMYGIWFLLIQKFLTM